MAEGCHPNVAQCARAHSVLRCLTPYVDCDTLVPRNPRLTCHLMRQVMYLHRIYPHKMHTHRKRHSFYPSRLRSRALPKPPMHCHGNIGFASSPERSFAYAPNINNTAACHRWLVSLDHSDWKRKTNWDVKLQLPVIGSKCRSPTLGKCAHYHNIPCFATRIYVFIWRTQRRRAKKGDHYSSILEGVAYR